MFGHKHEWHEIDDKSHHEDKPHGTFTRTIYYTIEECCKCGEQRKAIYNDWIHKPENDPDPNDKYTTDPSTGIIIGGLGYEKIER